MLFSGKWLETYVDLPADREELAHRLTMAGLPVERMETTGAVPPGVRVARILEAEAHPNADRLRVCRVDAGNGEVLEIVCGAPNARAGLVTALAPVGTELGEGFRIRKSKIRGVVSHGMLCSTRELGLGEEHEGILELPEGEPGAPLESVLPAGDLVLDVDITANRGDCMSHLGLAREIAALAGTEPRRPDVVVPEAGDAAPSAVSVEVEDPADCPRYLGRIIRDVTIGPSPGWLVERLEAVGQRSINNVVDVTNFVLLETGQPLHSFDLDRLGTGRVGVRRAAAGERLTTLDGVDRPLDPSLLVITDGARPVALAGIMGGEDTEVIDTTRTILLEGAVFHPGVVMRGSRRLRLETEAALRFRRGVDPVGVTWALDRAAQLIAELGGGTVAPGAAEVTDPAILEARTVGLRPERVGRLLGEELDDDTVAARLESLGLAVRRASSPWEVDIPSWRRDLAEECDLVEEVARLGGYDAIGLRQYNASAVNADVQPEEERRRQVADVLRGFGYDEAITRVLVDPELAVRAGFPAAIRERTVALADPPSLEESALRPSLLPSLLASVGRNLRRGNPETRLFEIGTAFTGGGSERPGEIEWVALAAAGGEYPPSRERALRGYAFADLKGALEALVGAFRIDPPRWRSYTGNIPVPAGTIELVVDGDPVGLAWTVDPRTASAWDLNRPVHLGQVRLDALPATRTVPVRYRDTSRFPGVRRDLALIVPAGRTQEEIRELVTRRAGKNLEDVELFDHYRGKPIPDGHVGLGYALTFRALDRTLEESEVDKAVTKIVAALAERGVRLRDG